jgi:hypothetical protein
MLWRGIRVMLLIGGRLGVSIDEWRWEVVSISCDEVCSWLVGAYLSIDYSELYLDLFSEAGKIQCGLQDLIAMCIIAKWVW